MKMTEGFEPVYLFFAVVNKCQCKAGRRTYTGTLGDTRGGPEQDTLGHAIAG